MLFTSLPLRASLINSYSFINVLLQPKPNALRLIHVLTEVDAKNFRQRTFVSAKMDLPAEIVMVLTILITLFEYLYEMHFCGFCVLLFSLSLFCAAVASWGYF